MISESGVYQLSNDEYHADPCPVPSLSTGVMKDLLFKSPLHAYCNHPKLSMVEKSNDDPKFDIGSAAHPMLLEGIDKVAAVNATDWRTKEAKEQRAKARAEGKVPLLVEQYSRVLAMAKAAEDALFNSELNIASISAQGDSELSYIWTKDDVWFRSRPDWVKKDRSIIIDYKTSVTANPAYLSRRVIDLGYDIQAAHYVNSVREIEGIEPKFYFLFQEVSEPYACSLVALDPQFLHLGRQKVSHATELWKHCVATGDWFGYPNRIAYLEMPPWAEAWTVNAPMVTETEEDI
ncbi:MAG: PD-(D/E)XK nuclease-like domain-containing protein [Methanothrix sp.]|nr:PD-(D/E)XK nuclease-like domain-containing protein [Methanothrix sp.]